MGARRGKGAGVVHVALLDICKNPKLKKERNVANIMPKIKIPFTFKILFHYKLFVAIRRNV
jgi:ribonucleotide reductase alpha subunit